MLEQPGKIWPNRMIFHAPLLDLLRGAHTKHECATTYGLKTHFRGPNSKDVLHKYLHAPVHTWSLAGTPPHEVTREHLR